MQYFELYARLGIDPKAARLPDEGLPLQDIDGVKVYVTSKAYAQAEAKRRGRAFIHRVLVFCSCGKTVPAGRLSQHLVAHKS